MSEPRFRINPATQRLVRVRQTSHSKSISSDPRKKSLYFPGGMLDEIEAEARRQERSLSWMVQTAWRIARERIREMEAPT
jgi:uncharacterized small protein (TIGR04563 family)